MKVFDLVFLTFSFCQMECSLEKLRAQERKISITGESLSQTEQCVRELDSLEKRAQVAALCLTVHVVQSVANMQIFLIDCVFQEEMSRAQVLILHGHQLAAGHHYAMALIIQRCNELRHQCDTLTSALNIKHNSLTQAQTLLRRLEEVG